MTPSPELSALMALEALGEATPGQQAELRRLLAGQPELAAELAALRDTALHMDAAVARDAGPQAVPSHILQRLEKVRQAVIDRAAAVAAKVEASQPSQTSRVRQRSHLALLAWAAVIALLAVPAAWWLIPRGQTIVATASPALAPRGETGMTQPTLVWENAPDQQYDVWILPDGADQKDAKALFVASNVRSPIQFASLKPGPANATQDASLKPGTRYLALVCLAGQGRMAGVTVPFQTAPAAIGAPPAPSDAGTALALARQLLDTGRPGDALMVLVGLPEDLRRQPEIVALEAEIHRLAPTTRTP